MANKTALEFQYLDELFESFIENLQLVIDKLKEEDSSRNAAPDFTLIDFWSKLETGYKSMSAEASKFSLWFSKPPLPKREECESLMESVQRVSLVIVSAYYGLPKEHGVRLRKYVRRSVLDVIDGVQTLAKRIKDERYQCSQGQLQSTGTVWEACDEFTSLPKNNCEAILQVIKNSSELVKDALQELQEAQETGGERDTGWDDIDEVLGRVDINDTNRNTWSEGDKAVLPPCIGLVKAARSCLKKVSTAVKSNGQWEDAHSIAQLDDLADIVDEVSPSVDELVSCVYAPMRHSVIRTNANQLSGVLLHLLGRCKATHVCKQEDTTWLNFLDQAVHHNLEKIKNLTTNEQDTS
ncbi:cyclin-D1-binding protein 1 homolog [Amphiura filiformis]|uniref:cyclin-D1-binding protein 1 homolog n=1 Tax=Amphiura filiformis TaxID=82378 RepID=UPI003B20C083